MGGLDRAAIRHRPRPRLAGRARASIWSERTVPAWQSAERPATVFTIHNLAYQGVFDASWLPRLGLGWDLMRVDALEYWNRISFLKGGIVFAGVITTVSPRYAEEIQTPELGFGFDGILRARSADLVGILNGIDYDQWDPERDLNLPVPFSASKMAGKAAAKRRVLEAFGLPGTPDARRRPLVAMISRMVDQKGFDLLDQISDTLPALRASFVLLGSGEPRFEARWRELATRHPNRIGVRIGFDDALAHLIEGGADIFLMPSRFEPCGLNQMYSLRYGTVPVVHATGGLFDTVHDVDRSRDGERDSRSSTTRRWRCSVRLDGLSRCSRIDRRGDGFRGRACAKIFRGTRRLESTSRCTSVRLRRIEPRRCSGETGSQRAVVDDRQVVCGEERRWHPKK